MYEGKELEKLKTKHAKVWKSCNGDEKFFRGFFDKKGNINAHGKQHALNCSRKKGASKK